MTLPRTIAAPILAALLLAGCRSPSKHGQNPVFIAHAVVQHAFIDLSHGKGAFADSLAKYFGTTRSEGLAAIEFVQNHPSKAQLEQEAVSELSRSLRQLETGSHEVLRKRFPVDVLSPYLQCVVHQADFPSELEQDIDDEFRAQYASSDTSDGLRALARSVRSYQHGGSFHADSLNLFNRQIIPAGFLLQLSNSPRQACLLDVADTLLPRTRWADSSFYVVLARRGIPCALGGEYGYSTLGSDFVVVIEDKIRQNADEYRNGLDPAWNGSRYGEIRDEGLWRSLGITMDISHGNDLLRNLLRREMEGKTPGDLVGDLVLETAIHEAKHKTDEIGLPTMNITYDSEVSAHLAQILCGNTPFHALARAIERFESFYRVSGDERMAELLPKLWSVATRAKSPTYSERDLRKEIRQVHDSYIARSSRTPLPPLDPFVDKVATVLKERTARAFRTAPAHPEVR